MKNLFYLCSLAIFTFSCGTGNNREATQDSTAIENTAAPEAGKKYSVKSGIIHQETEAMGIKMNPVIYFDDYGRIECSEIIMEMKIMGQTVKTHSATLIKDGYIYSIDFEKKTGVKMKSYAGRSSNAGIDFKSLSEEMKTKMNLKDLGNEEYLGKKCRKYSIDYKDMDMKGTYLVYDNIPLKMEALIGKMETKLAVTQFEENVNIPAGKFDVSADIKITDADAALPQQK